MTWTSGALCDFVREVKRRTRKGVELIQEGLHLILGNKVQHTNLFPIQLIK